MNISIRIDPRHERIRDIEMIGMMRVLGKHAPHRVARVIQRDLGRVYARIYCGDHNPMPDQDWREGRVRPVLAGGGE